ncbi:hypothetical protein [Ktedonospora formicarum]|uniref:Mannosyltransferase (PIG-V) n=1 Tax=Ktedonospora formicarum TaxID=2778364 RepID=A0A8J3I182_9CHLR|nr:hypothetical protein [Ktedonospora formicarum]GHO44377.1 hypothetical protein KSX_25400 [Ktedonospora formicarum]
MNVDQLSENTTLNGPPAPAKDEASTTSFWGKWWYAAKQVLPLYIAIHVAFLVLSYCAILFLYKDYFKAQQTLSGMLQMWHREDVNWYIGIAKHSYTSVKTTAFFPLFPLLMYALSFPLGGHYFLAGMLISNAAWFVMLAVLFQLVKEEFDEARAHKTVLYLSVFPAALFFATAYTETLFIALMLISFYSIRKGYWWWAAIFAFLAGLTRSSGVFLAIPFCYEYLRQRQFKVRAIRWDILSIALIPFSVILFGAFCFWKFNDPLSFTHAQVYWVRVLSPPWFAFASTIDFISRKGFMGFWGIRNMLDLYGTAVPLILLILGTVGPWRLRKEYLSYLLLGWTLFIFVIIVPIHTAFPLQSTPRLMLELFPSFIVLAGLGKNRYVHLNYVFVSAMMLFILLTLYLTFHWVV